MKKFLFVFLFWTLVCGGTLSAQNRWSINPDGSISLHARRIQFVHPVSGKEIDIIAPVPAGDRLWAELEQAATHD